VFTDMVNDCIPNSAEDAGTRCAGRGRSDAVSAFVMQRKLAAPLLLSNDKSQAIGCILEVYLVIKWVRLILPDCGRFRRPIPGTHLVPCFIQCPIP
jgi:hypothetical protein